MICRKCRNLWVEYSGSTVELKERSDTGSLEEISYLCYSCTRLFQVWIKERP